MAGIGTIGGGATPFAVRPPGNPVAFNGRKPSGVLGTRAGLGESNSVSVGPGTAAPIENNADSGVRAQAGLRELTADEQREVQALKRRDAEVRRHEQAHVAAAGRYAQGGPQYEFTTGPDGRPYATGGHVRIDVSPANTPEATLQKARTVRRAALAPAEPSAEDRAVAAEASQLEREAQREIREARQAEDGGEPGTPSVGPAQVPGALHPPPAVSRREISEYIPDGGGASAISGTRRLDVQA